VTTEEPFYLPRVVDIVASGRPGEISAVVVLPPFSPKSGGWREVIQRQFMLLGFRGFVRRSFAFTLRRILDRLGAGGYSVVAVCRRHGIPVLRPPSINAQSFLDELRAIGVDVIVSISASQIFRKEILALPRHGCINVHSGMLPRYRGMLPSFWVLANGEREAGVTVHYMDEKLDNGDIILQKAVPIEPGETQHTLLRKTKAAGAYLVLEALQAIEEGRVERKPNDASQSTYFSFPTPEDVRRFRRAGKRFF
jgi:methionyl-tRNA formyltransferase